MCPSVFYADDMFSMFPKLFTDVLDMREIKCLAEMFDSPMNFDRKPPVFLFRNIPGYPSGLFICRECIRKSFCHPEELEISNIPLKVDITAERYLEKSEENVCERHNNVSIPASPKNSRPSSPIPIRSSPVPESKQDVYTYEQALDLGIVSKNVKPGSSNQKAWKIHVKTNGNERRMWANLYRQKDLLKDLEKLADLSIRESEFTYEEFLASILKERKYDVMLWNFSEQTVVSNTKTIFAKALVCRNKVIRFMLMREDLTDLSSRVSSDGSSSSMGGENVYADYVFRVCDNNKQNYDAKYCMNILTSLYFTENTFPAWRAVFYVIWKHIRTTREKKKIARSVIRRVLWCKYTSPIFKLMSQDVVLLSLYDHVVMASKKVKQQRMQIYELNYKAIKSEAVNKILEDKPNTEKRKRRRKIQYRLPRGDIPSPISSDFGVNSIFCTQSWFSTSLS